MPQDITKGYCVKFYAKGEGTYGVGEPIPIEEGEDTSEPIADMKVAIKKLVNVVKSNPATESAQEQFNAGFGPEPNTTPTEKTSSDMSMPY